MTTANKITVARILLVPVFVAAVLAYAGSGNEWHRLGALVTFAIAALSDGIDGYLARHCRQKSELGAVLDPLADKLLVASGVILLSLDLSPHLPRIPLYVTAIILGRDMLLFIGAVVIHVTCGKVKVRPVLLGKAAAVLQMALVLWILLKWPEPALPWWGALTALATGISGAIYVVEGVRQFSATPRSAPSPKS